jgi:hypothetical protein
MHKFSAIPLRSLSSSTASLMFSIMVRQYSPNNSECALCSPWPSNKKHGGLHVCTCVVVSVWSEYGQRAKTVTFSSFGCTSDKIRTWCVPWKAVVIAETILSTYVSTGFGSMMAGRSVARTSAELNWWRRKMIMDVCMRHVFIQLALVFNFCTRASAATRATRSPCARPRPRSPRGTRVKPRHLPRRRPTGYRKRDAALTMCTGAAGARAIANKKLSLDAMNPATKKIIRSLIRFLYLSSADICTLSMMSRTDSL